MSRYNDHDDEDFEVAAYDSTSGTFRIESRSADDFECTAPPSKYLSSDEKTTAVLAHIGVLIAGVFFPIGVWLLHRKRKFVNYHARQSLNHQLTLVVCNVLILLLSVIVGFLVYRVLETQRPAMLCGVAVYVLLLLGLTLFSVISTVRGTMAASRGNLFRYPMTISFF
jgi:hypothetical protein